MGANSVELVFFRLATRVIAGRHGKSVGDNIRGAEYKNDAGGKISADDPANNGKGRHRPIEAVEFTDGEAVGPSEGDSIEKLLAG